METKTPPLFFIITGAPGTGKSSLLRALGEAGYATVRESARDIIQEQTLIGGDGLHTRNRMKFFELMLSRDILRYREADSARVTFFDRGIPDLLGYCEQLSIAPPQHLLRAVEAFQYQPKVFIPPPWLEIYEQDVERTQTFCEAEATHERLLRAYKGLNFQVIDLPCCDVAERVKFMQHYIQ